MLGIHHSGREPSICKLNLLSIEQAGSIRRKKLLSPNIYMYLYMYLQVSMWIHAYSHELGMYNSCVSVRVQACECLLLPSLLSLHCISLPWLFKNNYFQRHYIEVRRHEKFQITLVLNQSNRAKHGRITWKRGRVGGGRPTYMPNRTPPRWAAWSNTLQPITRPAVSSSRMNFSAWTHHIIIMHTHTHLMYLRMHAYTHTHTHIYACTHTQ